MRALPFLVSSLLLLPLVLAAETNCYEPAGEPLTLEAPTADGGTRTFYVYERTCSWDPEYCGWFGPVSNTWILEESNGVRGMQLPDEILDEGRRPCADSSLAPDTVIW